VSVAAADAGFRNAGKPVRNAKVAEVFVLNCDFSSGGVGLLAPTQAHGHAKS